MNIRLLLIDADGKASTRYEQLRWLLNLVSAALRRGQVVTITTEGGTIRAERGGGS